MDWFLPLLGFLGAAAVGALIKKAVDDVYENLRAGGLRRDKVPHLRGTWHALWQTQVEGKENLNHEILQIEQRRTSLRITNVEKSLENPIGGYLWEAKARIHDQCRVLAQYKATDKNVAFKGVFYLSIHGSGSFMIGQWAGCSYDSELAFGYVALAKSLEECNKKMELLLAREATALGEKHDVRLPSSTYDG